MPSRSAYRLLVVFYGLTARHRHRRPPVGTPPPRPEDGLNQPCLPGIRPEPAARSRRSRPGPAGGRGGAPADPLPSARLLPESHRHAPGAAGEARADGLHTRLLDGEDPGELPSADGLGHGGEGFGVPGRAAEPQQPVADGGRGLHVDADVAVPADGRGDPTGGVREAHAQIRPVGQVRPAARACGDRPAVEVLADLPQQGPQQGPRGGVLHGAPRRQFRGGRPVGRGDGQRGQDLLAPADQVVHALGGGTRPRPPPHRRPAHRLTDSPADPRPLTGSPTHPLTR